MICVWFMILRDWNIQVQWPGDPQNLPTLTSIFKPRARFNATLNSSKGVTSSKSVSKTCKTHQSWCWDCWDLWLCQTCTYPCLHVDVVTLGLPFTHLSCNFSMVSIVQLPKNSRLQITGSDTSAPSRAQAIPTRPVPLPSSKYLPWSGVSAKYLGDSSVSPWWKW